MSRLFETHDEPQGTLTQRAVWWAMFMSEIVIIQSEIQEQIPEGATLIALPTDDLELLQHNLALAEKSADELQVFVRVNREEMRVNVFSLMQMSTHTYRAA